MAISNKGQLSSMYKGVIQKTTCYVVKNQHNSSTIQDDITKECNKPLQSKWYVSTKSRPRFEWNYYNKKQKNTRLITYGNICYEAETSNWRTVKTTEEKQRQLYNRLKKAYEKKQEKAIITGEVSVTKEEKLKSKAKKKAIQLLTGLASQPRYDRIYGVG